jgi:hypothetical protein
MKKGIGRHQISLKLKEMRLTVEKKKRHIIGISAFFYQSQE